MKIRLAKKIMKHKCTFLDLEEKYKKKGYNVKWLIAWGAYDEKKTYRNAFTMDHRIAMAMSLVEHWNARWCRNEAAKLNKKNPLRPRDLRRSVERLKQYSV